MIDSLCWSSALSFGNLKVFDWFQWLCSSSLSLYEQREKMSRSTKLNDFVSFGDGVAIQQQTKIFIWCEFFGEFHLPKENRIKALIKSMQLQVNIVSMSWLEMVISIKLSYRPSTNLALLYIRLQIKSTFFIPQKNGTICLFCWISAVSPHWKCSTWKYRMSISFARHNKWATITT